MTKDVFSGVEYLINDSKTIITIMKHNSERTLTNLMPEFGKHWKKNYPTVNYIEYVDSDGEPTLYNIAMDSYHPLPKE